MDLPAIRVLFPAYVPTQPRDGRSDKLPNVQKYWQPQRYRYRSRDHLEAPGTLRSSAMNRTILTVLVFVCVTSAAFA
jgi:hypothetical protein